MQAAQHAWFLLGYNANVRPHTGGRFASRKCAAFSSVVAGTAAVPVAPLLPANLSASAELLRPLLCVRSVTDAAAEAAAPSLPRNPRAANPAGLQPSGSLALCCSSSWDRAG